MPGLNPQAVNCAIAMPSSLQSSAIAVEVLALPRPELDGRKAERGGHPDPIEKWQLRPPHFDVDGELGMRRAAEILGVDDGSG